MTTATKADRIYNFSAGPATLPMSVLEQAQQELLCLPGAGASVLEISHRSKDFQRIIDGAEEGFRKLLNIPANYKVLFLQGGASLQFSMLPMNFLEGRKADYVRSGAWAKKAISEARKHGEVRVIWDGADQKFSTMPVQGEVKPNPDAAYVHVTSNETIEGTELHYDPDTGSVPLVCDASSDFLHRPLDVNRYAMIYAGAQKNVGPAGCTLVIMRDDFLATQVDKTLPTMLNYKEMAEAGSLYNTPPCFTIYVIGLVTRWLLEEVGGLEKMHELNRKKAGLLYDAIDQSGGFYRGHADKSCRSLMNVTFRLPSEELEKKFAAEAEAKGMSGLKGHRSVGGLRASIYNAFPIEGVQALVDFMGDFQKNA